MHSLISLQNLWSKTTGASMMAAAIALISLFALAAPAFAGVAGSTGPTYPVSASVGQTNVPASLLIVNNSTVPQNTESVLVTEIFHTPSCGSDASSICQLANADPGVFQIVGPVTGQAGTACAGTNFTVSAPDPVTGEVEFTPNVPVVLGPSNVGGAAATCVIDFAVNVLKVPTKDSGAATGVQTSQLSRSHFKAQTTEVEGSGSGSSQVTVNKASPSISTIPSAGGQIGTVLNDTATLTGGASPTGSVTFKLFPPSDPSCTSTPSYTQVDPTAPYATSPGFVSNAAGVWHWSADYAGDANNNATSSPCSAEPVTIVAPGHIIVDKVTIPSGDPQSFAFTTTGAGYSGFSLTDAATPNDQTLPAGTYSVAETPVAGWSSDGGICDNQQTPGNITLAPGQTVTCTFTNTIRPGHLIVQKTTLPAGDTTSFGITASGSGTITGSATGTITDATDKVYTVTAGTYSVAETVPAGWDKTGDTCQNVVVAAGATSTCVITNTKRGRLIVDKITNPAGDSTSFSILASGNGTITGSASGNVTDATNKEYEVTPGTYSIAETVPSGWNLSSSTCNNVVVGAGETKTCQIVNTKIVVAQGCSPGYWKQSQHFGSYPTPTAYPNTLFSTIFGNNVFGSSTLLQVLSNGGGGQIALGRIMVGAYLKASTVTGFPYTPAQVIAAFNGATPATYDSVKATFEALQDPCPFGRNPGAAGPGLPVSGSPGKSGKNR